MAETAAAKVKAAAEKAAAQAVSAAKEAASAAADVEPPKSVRKVLTKEEKAEILRRKFEANLAKLNANSQAASAVVVRNSAAKNASAAKRASAKAAANYRKAAALVEKVAKLTMKNKLQAAHNNATRKMIQRHHSF